MGAGHSAGVVSAPSPTQRIGRDSAVTVKTAKENGLSTGELMFVFPQEVRTRVFQDYYDVDNTVKELGKGHYGSVRKGLRLSDSVEIAVKTISKKNAAYVEMLRCEVAILRAISGWVDDDEAGPPMPLPGPIGPGLPQSAGSDRQEIARALVEAMKPARGTAGCDSDPDDGNLLGGGLLFSSLAYVGRIAAAAISQHSPQKIARSNGQVAPAPFQLSSNITTASIEDSTSSTVDTNMSPVVDVAPEQQEMDCFVRLLDAFEDDKQAHLVFELCTGGEVFSALADTSFRFSEPQAARIVRQMLQTVHMCHGADIVHRDLKPENLLLVTPGVDSDVKVVDFGLATTCRLADKLVRHVGTPYYTAPEVLSPPYGRECDMWSVGVITFALLAGYPPFFGDTDTEIYGRLRKGIYAFEGVEWNGNEYKEPRSAACKAFISRLLIREPENRLSAQAALSDPWILYEGAMPVPVNVPLAISGAVMERRPGDYNAHETERCLAANLLLSRLRSFAMHPPLKRCALRVLVSRCTLTPGMGGYALDRQSYKGLPPMTGPPGRSWRVSLLKWLRLLRSAHEGCGETSLPFSRGNAIGGKTAGVDHCPPPSFFASAVGPSFDMIVQQLWDGLASDKCSFRPSAQCGDDGEVVDTISPKMCADLLSAAKPYAANAAELCRRVGSYVCTEPLSMPSLLLHGATTNLLHTAMAEQSKSKGLTPPSLVTDSIALNNSSTTDLGKRDICLDLTYLAALTPSIGYRDFSAALCPRLLYLDSAALLAAFREIDADGDGVIGLTDIMGLPGLRCGGIAFSTLLCSPNMEEDGSKEQEDASVQAQVRTLAELALAEADFDADGVVGMSDFVALMCASQGGAF